MSVNFNSDDQKYIFDTTTSNAASANNTQIDIYDDNSADVSGDNGTIWSEQKASENSGFELNLESKKSASESYLEDLDLDDTSKWDSVEAQKNKKFLFFGNAGYTFKTSSGIEITIENPEDLGDIKIYENKETGEVVVMNANVAKIKSNGDDSVISVYNSQIDSIDTKKGDDTISIYDSTVDKIDAGKGSDDVSIYNSIIKSLKTGSGSDIINIDGSSADKIKTNSGFLFGLPDGSSDTINIDNTNIDNLKTGKANDTVIASNSNINTLKTKGGKDSVSLVDTEVFEDDLGKEDLKVENGNYLADFDVSKMPKVESSEVITLQSGVTISVSDYISLIAQQEVGFETEIEYQQYAIQAMSDNLESMKQVFQAQNDSDGVMADGFSGLKELTGLGISSKDVENIIAEQEEIIAQLTLAMQGQSDLTFEEAYEKYTGTKFSTEKIDNYMRTSNIASAINSACYYDEDYADKLKEATGKTVEEINQEFALCQNEALGKSQTLQNLVDDYSASQESFADKLSALISTTGMVCIVAGAIISFIPGGAAIGVPLMTAGKWVAFGGMLADNAIDLVDYSTDTDGLTGDEVKNLALETGVELVSYGAGRAIGFGTSAINSFVSREAAKQGIGTVGSYILGQTAETVADTALSLGADYIITQGQSLITTGEMVAWDDYWSVDRFLGEGRNQLMGILTGLSSSKISAYSQSVITTTQIKIQAGDIEGAKSYLRQSGLGQYASGTKFNNIEASAKMPTIMPEVNARIQAGDVEGAKQILSDNGLSSYTKGKKFTLIEQQAHISKAQEMIIAGNVEGARQYLSDNGLEKYSTGDNFKTIQAQANAPEILANAQRMILEGNEKEAQQYLRDEGLGDYATRENFYQLTIQTKAPQVMAEVERLILEGDEAGAKQYLKDNGFKEYTSNEKFNTIVENIKTANAQASAVETAKTMILEGDLDGARKLLENSGLEVDDESFKALCDEILAAKTENEVKTSQDKVEEDIDTDAETLSGRLKIDLQFFAERPNNIDTQKSLQERMDEVITIDKISTLTEEQKLDMLSDVGLTTKAAYERALLDNKSFQRVIYLSKLTYPNGDSFEGSDISPLLALSGEDFQRIEDFIIVENRSEQFRGRFLVRLAELSDEELSIVKELLYIPERGEQQFSGGGLLDLSELSPEEFEQAKKLFYVEERGEQQFSASDIISLTELSSEDFARAKTYFALEDENGQKFSGSDITTLSQLNEQEFSKAQRLFNIPERANNQLPLTDIVKIASELTDEQFANVEKLLQTKNIDQRFGTSDIIKLSKELTTEQIEHLDKLIYIDGREEQISSFNIKEFAMLNNEQFARVEQLLYVEGREKQFDDYDIKDFIKLNDEQFARAQQLFYVEGADRQFNKYDIVNMAVELNDEQFAVAQKLLYIEGRNKQLSAFDIKMLAEEYDEQGLENIAHLLNVPQRGENQFGAGEIKSLAALTAEEYEKAKSLFNVPERGENQFGGYQIAALSRLSFEEYEKAKTLFYIPQRGDNQFSGEDIVKLTKLNDQEYEKAKTLFYIPQRGDNQFSGGDIVKLTKLNDQEYKKAKSLFYIPQRGEAQLSAYDIAELAKLSDDEFKKAKTLVNLESRNEQFSSYQIEELVRELNEEQFARIPELLQIKTGEGQISLYRIGDIAKYDNQQYSRFIELSQAGLNQYDIEKSYDLNEAQYRNFKDMVINKQYNSSYARDLCFVDETKYKEVCEIVNIENSSKDYYIHKICCELDDTQYSNFKNLINNGVKYNIAIDTAQLESEKVNTILKLCTEYEFDGYDAVKAVESLSAEQIDMAIEISNKYDIPHYSAIEIGTGLTSSNFETAKNLLDSDFTSGKTILYLLNRPELISKAILAKKADFSDTAACNLASQGTDIIELAIKLKAAGFDETEMKDDISRYTYYIDVFGNDYFPNKQKNSYFKLVQAGFDEKISDYYVKLGKIEMENLQTALKLKKLNIDDAIALELASKNIGESKVQAAAILAQGGFEGDIILACILNEEFDFNLESAKIAVKLKELGVSSLGAAIGGLQSKTTDINIKTVEEYINTGIFPDNALKLVMGGIDLLSKINLANVPKESQTEMFKNFFANNSNSDEIIKSADFTQFGKEGIPLEYSRTSFIEDLNKVLSDVPETQKTEILEKLNIELTQDGNGYNGIIDLTKLGSEGAEGQVLEHANRFILNNKVTTGNAELDQTLNSLIAGMPEFVNTIGKQQHDTHGYSLDVHILETYRTAISDSDYNKLSDYQKFELKLMTILHDISKQEKMVDDNHPIVSAKYASNILDRYNLPESTKYDIVNNILNHHWGKDYNTRAVSVENTAIQMGTVSNYDIQKIFAKADLIGMGNTEFSDEKLEGLSNDSQRKLILTLSKTKETTPLIYTTPIVKPNLIPSQTITLEDGTTKNIRSFNLKELSDDYDMEEFGFLPNTKAKDVTLGIHTANSTADFSVFKMLTSNPVASSPQSVSIVSKNDNALFKRFGVAINLKASDVLNATHYDQGCGTAKTQDDLINIATGDGEYESWRKIIPNKIQEKLGITESEYSKLASIMEDYKYLSQISDTKEITIGNKTFTGKEIKNAISTSEAELMQMATSTSPNDAYHSGDITELVVRRAEVLNNTYVLRYNSLDDLNNQNIPEAERQALAEFLSDIPDNSTIIFMGYDGYLYSSHANQWNSTKFTKEKKINS